MNEVQQKSKRISDKEIKRIREVLSDTEKEVLHSISECRYLTTKQIKRLYYIQSKSEPANMRRANRSMIKLWDYGLVRPLDRRIGGVRAGSGSYVWQITSAGIKVLLDNEDTTRKRNREPTSAFLLHTLMVSEVYIGLIKLSRDSIVGIEDIQLEPQCWRTYTSASSENYLKPDLYAVITNGEYEDYYFFEIDNGTESPSRVIKKCQQYEKYYTSGYEQTKTHVFPYVIWIVPDQKRKVSLTAHIKEDINLSSIFVIITLEELSTLIISGADALGKPKEDVS